MADPVTPPDRVAVESLVKRAAVALAAVAFAGSWLHIVTFAMAEGQPWPLAVAIATMPEVSVAVCILVLRSGPPLWRGVWAAVVLVTSAAFTVRANLGVTVPDDPNAVLVAVWPAWAAIGAAGLVEAPRHRPATTGAGRAARAATVARQSATRAATAVADEAAAWAEPPATRPATRPAAVPAAEAGAAAAAEAGVAAAMAGDFPRGRGKEAEQVQWFARQLPLYPDRTDEQWAARTGLSERTVQRRIERAGGRPKRPTTAEEFPALSMVASGG